MIDLIITPDLKNKLTEDMNPDNFLTELDKLIQTIESNLDQAIQNWNSRQAQSGGATGEGEQEEDQEEPDEEDPNIRDVKTLLNNLKLDLFKVYKNRLSDDKVKQLDDKLQVKEEEEKNNVSSKESEIKTKEESIKSQLQAIEDIKYKANSDYKNKFYIALILRLLMANEKRTQNDYDEKMIEFIKKDKEIKKRRRSILYMFKSDKQLKKMEEDKNNLEEEIENILNRCEDCVVKKKITTKGRFFSSSTKDPNFERMENMVDNEKYQVYDRSKTLLGKGKERGKRKKEYNYGYKNLYDFNTAFKVFQSQMMRDEKGIIVDFKDDEGESVFETQIYKEGVPFFYADIIRIALLENDMETLKETVVFLEKQMLNNNVFHKI